MRTLNITVGGAYGSDRKNSRPFYDALMAAFPYDDFIYIEKSMDSLFGDGEDERISDIKFSLLENKDTYDIINIIGKSYGGPLICELLSDDDFFNKLNKKINLILIDPTNAKYPWFKQKYHGRSTITVDNEKIESSILFYEDESENKHLFRAFLDYRHRNVIVNGYQVRQVLILGADHFSITRKKEYIDQIINYIKGLR
jgi:hypothetical protein